MQIGFNQNVDHAGHTFHVQTEDVADRAELVTHVFLAGQVLHTYRLPYREWMQQPGWEQAVWQQARKQHALMVAAVQRGRIQPPA